MAVARHAPLTAPEAITRFGSLLIAPRSVGGRMMSVCRNAFEDISGCMAMSRPVDLNRDALILNIERLSLRGIQVSRVQGCACAERYQAIAREAKAAQTLDARIDALIWGEARTTARRLAGAIGKLFSARRGSGRGASR